VEVSVLQKTDEEHNMKHSCHIVSRKSMELWQNIPVLQHKLRKLSWFESSHGSEHFQISWILLPFLQSWARWKYVWMSMCEGMSSMKGKDKWNDWATQTRSRLLKRPFHGSLGSNSWFAYTSSGYWLSWTTNSLLESFLRILNCLSASDKRRNRIRRTHSGFFQSKPAGQRSAPMTGWWKPLFILTFQESGGTITVWLSNWMK